MALERTAPPTDDHHRAVVPDTVAPLARGTEDIDARRAKERFIRRQIQENCPYVPAFRRIHYEYRGGMLTVHGQVPSYYLKQLLHTYLRNLLHDEQIRDEVEVVSPAGERSTVQAVE
jgi:hypothetical protein